MLRRLITAILAVTAFAATAVIVPVDSLSRNRQSVGLVLSGGGAKGIAHIGVIKALEENDIPIDYIAGTSMGAIVGGLYAAGYTTDEMMALLASREFTAWSTGQVNPKYMYYFSRPEPSPTLFSIPIATKSDSLAARVPSSLISPLPMNFGFMDVFAAYTAQCKGDFNRLFVPFRCVSSDVEAGHKVVHRSGSLGDAIRTSMSFPIVFQPIRVNGVLQYDGGIFDNFPVDVMEEDFSPDIMIGVDVSTPSTGPQTSLMDQIDNLVMKKQTYALPADRGIKLHIDLHQFSLLDFAKAPRIASIGYDHAMSMMDSIKGRVTARIPAIARRTARETFKAQSPYLRFDSVTVTGASPKQNRFIEYLFRPAHADTFGIVHARESFYRAVTPGRLRDLFPVATQNDSSSLFTLHLTATPKSNFTVGVGGYITSSTNSFLYASAGYNTLSFSSISANISAWLGQSYMAALANAAFILHTGIPSKIGLQAVVMRQRFFQSDRLFFEDTSPSFIVNHEYYGRLHYDLAAGARGRFCIAAGYGHLNNSFYLSDIHFPEGRAHSSYNLGQVRLSYDGGTLNDVNFPTSGSAYSFIAQGILGNYRFRMPENHTPVFSADEDDNVRWLQIESRTRNYFDISKHFAFGLESDVLLSTRKLVSSYNSAIVSATPYYPTAASHNSFTPAFRANSFVAAGLVPIYKYNASLSARLHLHGFMPVRPILEMHTGKGVMAARYGDYFSRLRFFGELDVAYTLPFATLSVYGNYTSAGSRHWNCGISLGIFIQAPRFLR